LRSSGPESWLSCPTPFTTDTMPLIDGGSKTLWFFTGVFLFMCGLVIVETAEALPLALCLPSLYVTIADRMGRRSLSLVLAAVPCGLVVVPGLVGGVVFYACIILCGVMLHEFMLKGKPGLAVLSPSCLLIAVITLIILGISYQRGIGPDALIAKWVANVMSQVASIYAQTLSPEMYKEFSATRAVFEKRFVQLFWGLAASLILFIMWLNLLMASGSRKASRLRDWKSPDWMVGFFIIASAFSVMNYEIIQVIGFNLLIVVSQIYFFQGMGIVSSAMIEHNWVRFIRLVIYILILSQIYIMIVVAALGLFDTWFDFRKMIRNTEGDKT